MPLDDPSAGKRGVRTHRFTMMIEKMADGGKKSYLYDNLTDPFQLKNLADEQSETVEELAKELKKWLAYTKDNW